MPSKSKKLSRRDFIKLSAAGIVGVFLGGTVAPWVKRLQQPLVDVMIAKENSYSNDLISTIRRGISYYSDVLEKVKGGTVVLKPNLIDYDPDRPLNTHTAMIAAAISAMRQLGAQEVIVAEGSGHNRDMEMILEQTGVDRVLRDEKVRFVDLNSDSISPVSLVSNYTKLSQFFFPNTILGADLVVSMPKLKTHHWAGATLSLKNLFGTIPGVKYGWPKNYLHWYGISQSIADISTTINPGFAIVDGIVGMEGDGPLNGTAVNSDVIIMGNNLTAVDSTAARIMNIYPENLSYLPLMLPYGGTINESLINQVGEPIVDVQSDFQVLPHMAQIKEKPPLWKRAIISGW
jgi:uncharacterized protein (DUF362 family)